MRIKELLKEKGMTQQDLAQQMGITSSALSQQISGKYAPTLDTLQRIADAIGVDIAELFAPIARCPHCGAILRVTATD